MVLEFYSPSPYRSTSSPSFSLFYNSSYSDFIRISSHSFRVFSVIVNILPYYKSNYINNYLSITLCYILVSRFNTDESRNRPIPLGPCLRCKHAYETTLSHHIHALLFKAPLFE
jgi:hypothetical protein